MAKMTLNKLIKELKTYKENGISERDIPDIKNLLIDYQNDNQMGAFEDLLYQMVDEDAVLDCIEYKARQRDFWGVQNIIEGLDRADWYRDNGDSFENITDADVEERLDEILDYAKSFKS